MKLRRSLQEELYARRALIGILQTQPNPTFTEMAGMCGYDFLMLDKEHGLFSDDDALQALRALSTSETLTMVRLRNHDTQDVGRLLDLGVDAILVPNVTSAEQARRLVRSMDYPPAGTRGFGASMHRATRYGGAELTAHFEAPRAGAALLVIIESALGVANVGEIVAVDGIDGVIIGPFDLSADFGHAGDFSKPEFLKAVARVEEIATAQRKILGTAPHPGSPLGALLARGHRVLIVGSDTALIGDAMRAQVERAKSSMDATYE